MLVFLINILTHAYLLMDADQYRGDPDSAYGSDMYV